MKVVKLLIALIIACLLGGGIYIFISSKNAENTANTSETTDTNVKFANISDKAIEEEAYSISLGFIGDICFADNYVPMQHLQEIGSDKLGDGIDTRYIEMMRRMDLMWVNNEFVYSDRGEAIPGKAWTFKAPTANVKYLRELGVDIAGLANNHVFDYGADAFVDTMDTLNAAGIPYVGAGHDFKEASTPVYLEAHGIKIAYVAASCAEYTIYTLEAQENKPGIMWCYDDEKFLDEIRTAAQNADFVVALPHWGTEHSTDLTNKQTSSAKAYIDAGADAVIGAHAHNLQGIEYYNSKPILYNLGNFWFDEYDLDTMLAEIKISGARMPGQVISIDPQNVEVILHPGRQVNVYTYLSENPEEVNRIFKDLEKISVNISIDESGRVFEIQR